MNGSVIMYPSRPMFRGGAAFPRSHEGNVTESMPQLPVVDNTYSRGRTFLSADRMQRLQKMVEKPPGSMQQDSCISTSTLSSMFRGLGFERSHKLPLGRGILGRGMSDIEVKPKVELTGQTALMQSRAGPAGDCKVERILLGRGRTLDLKEGETPFVALGRSAMGLGRAHGNTSALNAAVLQSAPLKKPSSEVPVAVSEAQLARNEILIHYFTYALILSESH
uniref:Uncharacterized protein n=1 Tax=Sphaerodactylus townsendi TaxID=933632 RepID=A0ACB8EXL3_9SAUR